MSDSLRWSLTGALLAVVNIGCAGTNPQPAAVIPVTAPLIEDQDSHWVLQTFSPQPAQLPEGRERQLVELCSQSDSGLHRVAAALAEHQATTHSMLDTEHVTHELRAAGVPQVWPRAWAIVGNPTFEEAKTGLTQWLASFSDGGQRRCGIARVALDDGREVISVIAVDALADLDPVPIRARSGQWLNLRARLLEGAVEAEVVVLGPRGVPRTVPTTLNGSEVRASFAVDQPGPWKVQVLPTFPSGPRPVLEAVVFVDQQPPEEFQALAVPGEVGGQLPPDPTEALFLLVNRARQTENLPGLARLEALDVAASIHAKAMMEARVLAHDVGMGSPTLRLEALGLRPAVAGENVAHALTVLRSHRALWDSPSHRSNLLHTGFTHIGLGLAQDTDGSVWVCEMFAEFPSR